MKSAIEHDNELDAFIEKIREWIGERDREALLDFMSRIPPPDLADLLVTMRVQEGLLLWRILPKEKAAEVFSHLDSNQKDTLISALSDEEIRGFLAGMEPDDRTDFFEDLPGEAVQRMINLIDPRQRQQTLEFLGYPEESVGRLMTPRYVAVRPDWTVGQALDHIRRKGAESETVNTIFATDRNWQLLDTVELGATLGLVASLLGLIRDGVALSAVILIAMTLIILISNLTGVVLPILLTKFGQDPAVASSPLVTSIADVLGLLIYFAVAAAVLK